MDNKDKSGAATQASIPAGWDLPKGWRQLVARAYVEWRKNDQTTPDDVLDLMRDILYAAEKAPTSQAEPVVAGQQVADGGIDARRELYTAAINCGHMVEADQIILYRNSTREGNALKQLGDRLSEVYARLAAPSSLPMAADARDQVLEEAAKVAEAQNRVGYEWVKDSVWDNIIKRVPTAIRALKAQRPAS